MRNKIGWCNLTFNPVWGCLNHCEYCYARIFAKRFGKIRYREEWKYRTEHNMEYADAYFKLKKSLDLDNFKLSFLYSQFAKKLPKKPQRIFVGSMSEIRYWKIEWISRVFKKIKEYPEHNFQFLTKHPYIYHRLEFPAKAWLGFTATTNKDLASGTLHIKKLRDFSLIGKYLYFVSIEPILEKINPLGLIFSDWVILGAETGKRKGKIIPKEEWVRDTINFCRDNGIPIYLKDSLKNLYPEEIKEFPDYK